MRQVRVLLLSTHDLRWAAVRTTLRAEPDRFALTEAADVKGVLLYARDARPDLILLPETAGAESTLDLIRGLRLEVAPASRVIVVAEKLSEPILGELSYLGISGLLFWRDLDEDNLADYLRAAAVGAGISSPHAVEEWQKALHARLCLRGGPDQLTERERAILCGLFQGLSRAEIGELLDVSERTVKRDIERIETKLDAHDLFNLGANAALLGFVP